jgi:aldose 1-epimerase
VLDPFRYSATWETAGGIEVAVLRDAESATEVRVAPELGNTCIGYRLGDWHVLDEPANENELRERASSYGIPILFPWPNRVRNSSFSFKGRQYHLPPSHGMPHANHGLVRERPWRTTRCAASHDLALVESQIHSGDFPELVEQYPSEFLLTVSYRLLDNGLEIVAQVVNTGDEQLPFGFGLHPYFLIPLGPSSNRARCTLRVPASEAWQLADHLPTGHRQPVAGRLDLRQGLPLGKETYDDVLTALEQPFQAMLRDPAVGREIIVASDGGFRECVVFAPADRPIVSIEPYTCATDALNLQSTGIDAGLRVLQPRESWRGSANIEPRLIPPGTAPPPRRPTRARFPADQGS